MKRIHISNTIVVAYFVTMITSAALFFVLVDQNTYLNRDGDKILFERVRTVDRIVVSTVFGWVYASVNAGLIALFNLKTIKAQLTRKESHH